MGDTKEMPEITSDEGNLLLEAIEYAGCTAQVVMALLEITVDCKTDLGKLEAFVKERSKYTDGLNREVGEGRRTIRELRRQVSELTETKLLEPSGKKLTLKKMSKKKK